MIIFGERWGWCAKTQKYQSFWRVQTLIMWKGCLCRDFPSVFWNLYNFLSRRFYVFQGIYGLGNLLLCHADVDAVVEILNFHWCVIFAIANWAFCAFLKFSNLISYRINIFRHGWLVINKSWFPLNGSKESSRRIIAIYAQYSTIYTFIWALNGWKIVRSVKRMWNQLYFRWKLTQGIWERFRNWTLRLAFHEKKSLGAAGWARDWTLSRTQTSHWRSMRHWSNNFAIGSTLTLMELILLPRG